MSTPDVGRALTHKVLHHNQPALFPLLDRQTADVLRPAGQPHGWNAWQVILADIDDSRADFEELRAWFAALAGSTRRSAARAAAAARHPHLAAGD